MNYGYKVTKFLFTLIITNCSVTLLTRLQNAESITNLIKWGSINHVLKRNQIQLDKQKEKKQKDEK